MKILNSKFKILNSQSAFTLIELLVVITIIGILITLVTVAVVPVQRRSRDAKRKAEVNSFLSGINLFKADFKIYPNPTFYLGSYGTVANGGINSNYALADDIKNCNIASVGATSTFLNPLPAVASPGNPTVNELNTLALVMNPGFVAVNNFLVCLRYVDRVLADPKPMSAGNEDKYQYRVSYDYGDAVVTSRLENGTTDSDASIQFTVVVGGQTPDPSPATTKRYYKGSGVVVRHLDDSSDDPRFFSILSGNNNDGKYLYQCKKTSDVIPLDISPDSRIAYEPIVTSVNGWVKNSLCNNTTTTGLDVIPAY